MTVALLCRQRPLLAWPAAGPFEWVLAKHCLGEQPRPAGDLPGWAQASRAEGVGQPQFSEIPKRAKGGSQLQGPGMGQLSLHPVPGVSLPNVHPGTVAWAAKRHPLSPAVQEPGRGRGSHLRPASQCKSSILLSERIKYGQDAKQDLASAGSPRAQSLRQPAVSGPSPWGVPFLL